MLQVERRSLSTSCHGKMVHVTHVSPPPFDPFTIPERHLRKFRGTWLTVPPGARFAQCLRTAASVRLVRSLRLQYCTGAMPVRPKQGLDSHCVSHERARGFQDDYASLSRIPCSGEGEGVKVFNCRDLRFAA